VGWVAAGERVVGIDRMVRRSAPFRSVPSTADEQATSSRQVQSGSEIFVFWSLLKTIFRKIPTPKHFLKIDHF